MPEILTQFISMIILMFVAAFTPGPNNIMLAASGANFGFRRTIPHMMGVVAGFAGLLLLAEFIINALYALYPATETILRVLALAFIVWIAWRIASSTEADKTEGRSRPQYFYEGALFQLINPKSLAFATTVMASYDFHWSIPFVAFSFITWLSVMTWSEFGVIISGFINTPSRLRVFNITMAVLLLFSMLPVLADIF